MTKRTAVVLVLLTLVALPAAVAVAAPKGGTWTGKATSMDRDVEYGKVTFTVGGRTIKKLKIEGVTTSGCGGFKSVLVPKLTIKGNRFSGSYAPVPDVEDIIVVHGTFKGSTASGTFNEGPLCENAGRFTAKAG